MILFNNKTFYRKRFYHYHEIRNIEQKGEWKIQDKVLTLFVRNEKEENDSDKWNKVEKINDFKIYKRKLIPNPSYEMFTDRKLKLIK